MRDVITTLRQGSGLQASRIEEAVRLIIEAIGESPQREGLRDTPRRIAAMYEELLAGAAIDPAALLEISFSEDRHDEIVVLRDVRFYSTCEHHFLPFFGSATVAYLPDHRLTGISKLARVVEAYARRLQLQERLTSQVADCLMDTLQPAGVAVIVRAQHLCMAMRGVRREESELVTTAMRGAFREDPALRQELFCLLDHGGNSRA